MNRHGRLNRNKQLERKPLKQRVEKAREFIDRGHLASARSLKASRGQPRRGRKPKVTKTEIRLALIFYDAGKAQGCCQSCGYVGPHVEVHHSIPKAVLKRELRSKGKAWPPELIWHPWGALLLCTEPAPNRCHDRHTLGVKRVRRSALRSENWAFARRLGDWAVDRLERDYPDDETRSDAA